MEAQQAESSERSANERSVKPPIKLSPEAAARLREQENFRLSRQSLLQQLKASQNPRHRKLLEDTLAALDQKIGRLP